MEPCYCTDKKGGGFTAVTVIVKGYTDSDLGEMY